MVLRDIAFGVKRRLLRRQGQRHSDRHRIKSGDLGVRDAPTLTEMTLEELKHYLRTLSWPRGFMTTRPSRRP